jgi:hypothetical protein
VPVLAPLAVLALAALILGGVLLSGCSGGASSEPDPGPAVDTVELADPGQEAEPTEVVPDGVDPACVEKPVLIINDPVANALKKGKPKIKLQLAHSCGVATLREHVKFPTGVKSRHGVDLGTVLIDEVTVSDPMAEDNDDLRLPIVFPSGAVDSEGHDLAGDEVPDGPVMLLITAVSACAACPVETRKGVKVVLDNHGPTVHLIRPDLEKTPCMKDQLAIEFWVEDAVAGLDKGTELAPDPVTVTVAVDDEPVATPLATQATADSPFGIIHYLDTVVGGSVTLSISLEDALGNETDFTLEVCVELLPRFRVVQKVGPRDESDQYLAIQTNWIDYGKFKLDGVQTPLVFLGTSDGVFASPLTEKGMPLHFKQLTKQPTDFVRAVPSRKGYPYALVVVEAATDGDGYQLSVYEDPYSVDGHPVVPDVVEGAEVIEGTEVVSDVEVSSAAELDVEVSDADTAEVQGPLVYDWGRRVESHRLRDAPTAEWMGDLIGTAWEDGGAYDAVIGTADPVIGLQIYEGNDDPALVDADGDQLWFKDAPTEIQGVDLASSIAVADADGDGLLDITLGRSVSGSFAGFKQTRQYEPGRFTWAQNYPAPASMAGVAVAHLAFDEDGSDKVPEIVAVSPDNEGNFVEVFQRVTSGFSTAHPYEPRPTFREADASFRPSTLLAKYPCQVMVTDFEPNAPDHLLDIVAVNRDSGNVTLLPSYATGVNFQVDLAEALYYNVGANPFRVWSFDLDQDGCPDLLTSHLGTVAYSWIRNPGCNGQTMRAALDSPTPPGGKPGERMTPIFFGVDDIDLQPNAYDDAVVLTESIVVEEEKGPQYPLWFYRSRGTKGDGVQSLPVEGGLLPPNHKGTPTDLEVGNVTKSANPDAVLSFLTPGAEIDPDYPEAVTLTSKDALAVMYWSTTGGPSGSGGFLPLYDPTAAADAGLPKGPAFYADPVAIALGHTVKPFDPDVLDVVTVHTNTTKHPSVLASYQANTGTVGAELTLRDSKLGGDGGPTLGPVDAVMGSLLSAHNQLNDVLVASTENQEVGLFLGTNAGKFSDGLPAFGVGQIPLAIEPVDWNNDGFLDVAVLVSDNLAVAYWNEGAGVFEPPVFFYGENPLASLSDPKDQDAVRGLVDMMVTDANYDCLEDLVVINKSRSEVLVFSSKGKKIPGDDGPPLRPTAFSTGAGPIRLAKGRFNDDPCDDIAVLNAEGQSFTTLINERCVDGQPPVECP